MDILRPFKSIFSGSREPKRDGLSLYDEFFTGLRPVRELPQKIDAFYRRQLMDALLRKDLTPALIKEGAALQASKFVTGEISRTRESLKQLRAKTSTETSNGAFMARKLDAMIATIGNPQKPENGTLCAALLEPFVVNFSGKPTKYNLEEEMDRRLDRINKTILESLILDVRDAGRVLESWRKAA